MANILAQLPVEREMSTERAEEARLLLVDLASELSFVLREQLGEALKLNEVVVTELELGAFIYEDRVAGWTLHASSDGSAIVTWTQTADVQEYREGMLVGGDKVRKRRLGRNTTRIVLNMHKSEI
jgi:hypothetical protein